MREGGKGRASAVGIRVEGGERGKISRMQSTKQIAYEAASVKNCQPGNY